MALNRCSIVIPPTFRPIISPEKIGTRNFSLVGLKCSTTKKGATLANKLYLYKRIVIFVVQAMKLRVLTGVHSPDQFRVQVNQSKFRHHLNQFPKVNKLLTPLYSRSKPCRSFTGLYFAESVLERVPPEGSGYSRTVVTHETVLSFPAPLYTLATLHFIGLGLSHPPYPCFIHVTGLHVTVTDPDPASPTRQDPDRTNSHSITVTSARSPESSSPVHNKSNHSLTADLGLLYSMSESNLINQTLRSILFFCRVPFPIWRILPGTGAALSALP